MLGCQILSGAGEAGVVVPWTGAAGSPGVAPPTSMTRFSTLENFSKVKNRVMLVGGATPGDPAAPVHGTTTPASPTPAKTQQPHIFGSLDSKQHLGVLHGDPSIGTYYPTWYPTF